MKNAKANKRMKLPPLVKNPPFLSSKCSISTAILVRWAGLSPTHPRPPKLMSGHVSPFPLFLPHGLKNPEAKLPCDTKNPKVHSHRFLPEIRIPCPPFSPMLSKIQWPFSLFPLLVGPYPGGQVSHMASPAAFSLNSLESTPISSECFLLLPQV